MGYIIILICVLFALFARKIEKNWYNPATVFFAVWAVVMFLYELRLFGIYDIIDTTYYVIGLGLVFFFVGYILITSGKRQVVISIWRNNVQPGNCIKYRLVKIFGIAVFALFMEEAIETLILMRTGVSLFDIRTSLQGYAEYGFSDNLYFLRSKLGPLYTWVILPVYNSMLILTCIDFFAGRRDKGLIALSIGCLLLKSFKEGSRVALFSFIIFLVFSMVIYGKKITLSQKAKKRLRIVIVCAALIIVVISNIRISTGSKTLIEEIYLYFTCCIPLLDHWLPELASGGFTYGATSLYGLIQLPATILTVLSGHTLDWYKAGQQAIQDTEIFVQIRNASYSYRSNAYTTIFYYFYKDLGLIGVALGSTLFGAVCTSLYKRLKKSLKAGVQSKRLVFVYLLLVQALVLSFIRSYFSVASYSFTFFYSYLFIGKEKRKEQE